MPLYCPLLLHNNTSLYKAVATTNPWKETFDDINIPLITHRKLSPFLSSVMRNIQMKSAGCQSFNAGNYRPSKSQRNNCRGNWGNMDLKSPGPFLLCSLLEALLCLCTSRKTNEGMTDRGRDEDRLNTSAL